MIEYVGSKCEFLEYIKKFDYGGKNGIDITLEELDGRGFRHKNEPLTLESYTINFSWRECINRHVIAELYRYVYKNFKGELPNIKMCELKDYILKYLNKSVDYE